MVTRTRSDGPSSRARLATRGTACPFPNVKSSEPRRRGFRSADLPYISQGWSLTSGSVAPRGQPVATRRTLAPTLIIFGRERRSFGRYQIRLVDEVVEESA